MSIVTTRRIDQLRAQCDELGIEYSDADGRLELFDKLRASTGGFDLETEIAPMKAKDLKSEIDWTATTPEERFHGIRQYMTDEWAAEPKLDGVRLRMFLGLTGNSLVTGRRSVKTFSYTQRTDNFPHLRDAVVEDLAGTILDGELLAPAGKIQTHTGTWTDSLLNASVALCNSNPVGSVQTQEKFGKALFYVFDVMAVRGEDVQHLPYSARRKMLAVVVDTLQTAYPDAQFRIVPSYESTPGNIQQFIDSGFEGAMLKKLSGRYEAGKRSKVWLKVKTFSTADSFVVGYAPGENANEGLVGSLDLAVICNDGTVRPVAQVGNLTHEMRVAISAPDGSLKQEFYGTVIEWMAQGLGKNGRARHAHMIRLRPDKSREDCLEDQLAVFPNV